MGFYNTMMLQGVVEYKGRIRLAFGIVLVVDLFGKRTS